MNSGMLNRRIKRIKSIGNDLTKELATTKNSGDIDLPERCHDLLTSIQDIMKDCQKDGKQSQQGNNPPDGEDTSSARIVVAVLKESMIGKTLTKAIKSMKRCKQSGEEDKDKTKRKEEWEDVIKMATMMVEEWKNELVKEQKLQSSKPKEKQSQAKVTRTENSGASASSSSATNNTSTKDQLPSSTSVFRQRLVTQRKEIYKDPPVLPPPPIHIYADIPQEQKDTSSSNKKEGKQPWLPKRNSKTQELTFPLLLPTNNNNNDDDDDGNDEEYQTYEEELTKLLKESFHPNRTPEEILRCGSFGGTYFRPIQSAVDNTNYTDTTKVLQSSIHNSWISNPTVSKNMLTSSTYTNSINKYKVKCGGSLGMWESSGWISHIDPYGWFQWYCRFYQGRRCSDDIRQIGRWCKCAGLKGRFRSQLCNKIITAGGGTQSGALKKVNDVGVSPVIRQTLLHWGLEITNDVLVKHGKRVGKF